MLVLLTLLIKNINLLETFIILLKTNLVVQDENEDMSQK